LEAFLKGRVSLSWQRLLLSGHQAMAFSGPENVWQEGVPEGLILNAPRCWEYLERPVSKGKDGAGLPFKIS